MLLISFAKLMPFCVFLESQSSDDFYLARTVDAALARNRSMPDIKPPVNTETRPTRGSSLTNPRSNTSPFHTRQRQQEQQHQTTTGMSTEPVTSATSGDVQDAYGGTVDDWRQVQQAQKEASERQHLKDSSPTEHNGHMSMNSVSTLNLPPITSAPIVPVVPSNMSMSRILLPDRDRAASKDSKGAQRITSQEIVVPEPTQETTSLAKATMQLGGILSQMKAATEGGNVVDPAQGVWSQAEGRYIQRANTAPYPARETRTILEENETDSPTELEYSKSEGHTAANRLRRQIQRQQQQKLANSRHSYLHVNNHVVDKPRQAFQNQPHSHLKNQMEQQQHHETQRRNASLRRRVMNSESALDTNKDLPPTPKGTPSPRSQHIAHIGLRAPYPRPSARQDRQYGGSSPRSRAETRPGQRLHRIRSLQRHAAAPMTSEESVIALSRSLSTTSNGRGSQEKSKGARGLSSAQSSQTHLPTQTVEGQKERVRYGIDMLPLPVIPSPDVTHNRRSIGILPQDVLKALDPQTIQKVITQSVIASRVYKVLSLEEVDNLRKVWISYAIDTLNELFVISTTILINVDYF